jgi:16S rRNA (uracil1498-N3)-methyltransferase
MEQKYVKRTQFLESQKLNISNYMAKDYVIKQQLLIMEKQSQTNPISRAASLNQNSFKTILSIMHLNRFYCQVLKKQTAELTGGEAHHLFNVCRLKKDDKVELFDGKGTLATASVEKATSKSVLLKIIDLEKVEKPTLPEVIIAVSLPKGERFDWLLEKCTELGVDHIAPVIFERTIKQLKNPKAVQRWRNITIAAAKQCLRIFLPQIDAPVTLSEVLSVLKKQYNQAEILVGSLEPESPNLITKRFSNKDVVAFVGPEGGITEDEKVLLEDCGAKFIRLTDTILRVETAALAFAVILTAGRDSGIKER